MSVGYVDIGGTVDHHCELRWEVSVGYVDIGGTVDHHCELDEKWVLAMLILEELLAITVS
jgi:hypothetical protein